METTAVPTSRFCQITRQGTMHAFRDIQDVINADVSNGYLWLDFYEPSLATLSTLIPRFKLHPLAIEDCLDDRQVSKFEEFPSNTFFLFNTFAYRDQALALNEIHFFLGKDFLISIRHGNGSDDVFGTRLQERLAQLLPSVSEGPDFLFHVILDHFIDEKYNVIEVLEDELDAAEDRIIEDPTTFQPTTLLSLRKHLSSLRKSIFHEREILIRICRKDSPFVSEKAIYHFRDIYDHLTKFYEETDLHREMLTQLMEIYLSMLNNRMTLTATRTNRFVRRLTFISTIFMPLTLLAGIGGMSEWTMMTGVSRWHITYPAFLGAMLLLGLVNYYVLKRLEKKDSDAY